MSCIRWCCASFMGLAAIALAFSATATVGALSPAPAFPSAPASSWWDSFAGSTVAKPAVPTSAIPGERGAPSGVAHLARKIAVVGADGRDVVNDGVVLVRDGKIEAVGPRSALAIPAGYQTIDHGERWITPGLVDLHCHIAGQSFLINDINDMVYLTNPELRASAAVAPQNPNLKRAIAGGVTTVLFIPGSGTNMGGQGVLLKTGLPLYEEMRVRDPGSLKLAQAGNPERWSILVGRSFMNWNTRNTFARGLGHAQARQGKSADELRQMRDIHWDVFPWLLDKRTQVSTHTQIFQVVLTTLTMVRQHFGVDVYIDHGEWFGSKLAAMAQELGVNAIVGPREIDRFTPGLSIDTDGQIQGIAAGYQKAGHQNVGFNTDSPVIPQEELQCQAAVATRYGFDASNMDALRGLTIVPAKTAGLGDRVGSIAPGKDADLLVCDGDPVDPRTTVEAVFIEGRRVYDMRLEERRW
jgi:imidazolonepropionase-like amidohydrolase